MAVYENVKDIKESYDYFACEVVGEDEGDKAMAASILVLASVFAQSIKTLEDFDHQIAIGIRKGLFGATAQDCASIDNTVSDFLRK